MCFSERGNPPSSPSRILLKPIQPHFPVRNWKQQLVFINDIECVAYAAQSFFLLNTVFGHYFNCLSCPKQLEPAVILESEFNPLLVVDRIPQLVFTQAGQRRQIGTLPYRIQM